MFLIAALTACGFAPRQAPELALKRYALVGFDRHTGMAEELRRQLRSVPGVQVGEALDAGPEGTQAVIAARVDVLERSVAASTAAGQVRELTLKARLRFEVRDTAGRRLIDETELQVSRDLSYTETTALAKEHEMRLLARAMHAELAGQILRRLAALPAPESAGPVTPASIGAAAVPAAGADAAAAAASAAGR